MTLGLAPSFSESARQESRKPPQVRTEGVVCRFISPLESRAQFPEDGDSSGRSIDPSRPTMRPSG
jgi:hypothetical protein